MKQILNRADPALNPFGNGGRFVVDFASLGRAVGARKLGVSLCVAPPGRRAFPKHAHHATEEMMFILAGERTCHCGATVHQIENTSDAELRCLTFSTKLEPEVVECPDSGKFAVVSKAGGETEAFRHIGRAGTSLDTFDDGA